MIVKVLLNRTTLDLSEDFQKAKEYFKPHLDLDLTFESSDIKGLTTKPVTGGGQALKDTFHVAGQKEQIKTNGEDIIIFCYNKDEFKVKVTSNMDGWIVKDVTLINLGTNKKDKKSGWIWKSIIHEIIHALFQKLYFMGHLVEDPLDKMLVNGKWKAYYKNTDPFAKDGNHAEALKRLAPYWGFFKNKPVVTIKRNSDDGIQTLGTLFSKNFSCFTLEKPWLNNKPNVSCIPKGTYECTYSFSPKFMKYTYEVKNVLGRSGIRFHAGNYFFDIQGCILLGSDYKDVNDDNHLDVVNSKASIKAFEESLMRQPFTLRID